MKTRPEQEERVHLNVLINEVLNQTEKISDDNESGAQPLADISLYNAPMQNSPNTKHNNKLHDAHNNKFSFRNPRAAIDKSKTMDLSRKADEDPEKENPPHSGKYKLRRMVTRERKVKPRFVTVSYTHLTLPTILLV